MSSSEVHDYGGRALRRFGAAWKGVSVERVRWQVTDATTGVTRQSDHQLFVTLAGSLPRTRAVLEDGHRYSGVDFPGAVSFIPATQLRRSDYARGVIEYVGLRVDPATVSLQDTSISPEMLSGFTNRNDPFIHQLAAALSREAEVPGAASQLFVDSALTTLMLHLARPAHDSTGPSKGCGADACRPLPRRRLREVVDHVGDNLDGDLRLDVLAEIAGMERSRFINAFKNATGVTPARYVAQRRLERAATLLREPARPIADIAATVGLSSQSHLTTAFKRSYGVTPQAFRRSHQT